MPLVNALTLLWLAPLAVYDLKKKAVPHIAVVAVPCFIAAIFATLRGDDTLAVMALAALYASERPNYLRLKRPALVLAIIALSALTLAGRVESLPGALAIFAFWIAYEIGWWAGADALAAMTLALLWPDILLIVALGVAHFVAAAVLFILRRRPLMVTSSGQEIAPEDFEGIERLKGATA